ncbi:hypothetical protein DO021_15610 [Desulfobacter hydrogenophilus]|uniref:Ankyrin repeat domain-containing protein n=1 Tax=Desulfobacter hydrogenophilus TaxID=2291 RepID=A0A328FCI1_9BACT|nr:ankyrin repeat domain-containing protein [Desulfobacter hydrogenophilus]NDY73108.1 ankyrin repeat domain-containing protein [Desulfobacter hydrogenophilus]QBH13546.1 ankyrin repeat domain-containing protein [Desulfobacter hydrogenophilus]RAM01112.1 hypothetical protein DO021_15610 [Desulfobacter hydrogenophilus]
MQSNQLLQKMVILLAIVVLVNGCTPIKTIVSKTVKSDGSANPTPLQVTGKPVNRVATITLKILSESMKRKDVAKIQDAIQSGADVNVRDKYGFTPLHMASENGHAEIVGVIKHLGENPHRKIDNKLIYKTIPMKSVSKK